MYCLIIDPLHGSSRYQIHRRMWNWMGLSCSTCKSGTGMVRKVTLFFYDKEAIDSAKDTDRELEWIWWDTWCLINFAFCFCLLVKFLSWNMMSTNHGIFRWGHFFFPLLWLDVQSTSIIISVWGFRFWSVR